MTARLEYRLNSELHGYPVLFYYQKIGRPEVSLRFACDYFVKEKKVYEKTSCAIDRGTYVVYVKEAEEEKAFDVEPLPYVEVPRRKEVQIEMRLYSDEAAEYPLLQTLRFTDEEDVLLHLQTNLFYFDDQEWERTSTEIDEDRQVFVLYVQKAG